MGAAAGLRQAEATGLTVDRLNQLGRSLTVDRQILAPTAEVPMFGPPKTAKSFRTVPLGDVAVEEIAAHLSVHGAGDEGLVLHEDGRAIPRPRFGRVWRQVRAQAGLPAARFQTRGTRSRRRCCRAACRWRLRPTISGTPRRCS